MDSKTRTSRETILTDFQVGLPHAAQLNHVDLVVNLLVHI